MNYSPGIVTYVVFFLALFFLAACYAVYRELGDAAVTWINVSAVLPVVTVKALPFIKQCILFGLFFLAYKVSRMLAIANEDLAIRHAYQVMALERRMLLFVEIPLQRFIMQYPLVIKFLNQYYVWGHFPPTLAFFAFLFFRQRRHFACIRDVFYLSNCIAAAFYIGFPCAPPRLFDNLGFVDTLLVVSRMDFYKQVKVLLGVKPNQYAAVPSMHFGYVLLLSVTMARIYGRRAWLAPGIIMGVAVVCTGNHFVFDVLLGAIVVYTAFYLIEVYAVKTMSPAELDEYLPWPGWRPRQSAAPKHEDEDDEDLDVVVVDAASANSSSNDPERFDVEVGMKPAPLRAYQRGSAVAVE